MSDLAARRSFGYASTPLGRVLLVTAGHDLLGLFFDGHARSPSAPEAGTAPRETLDMVRIQLDEYFQGRRTRFDLRLRLEGTPFQLAVWSALLDIPYGTKSTYSDVATQIGRPRAARAVGAANGRNPISIIVPCHRLVGADGGLTGYGGGIDRKRSLLELEGALRRSSSDRWPAG
ncbi:MAG: methylated-DNA--[protein]-cysteine S-methyltransferase [Candidatus Dormiibacterota bacterium]